MARVSARRCGWMAVVLATVAAGGWTVPALGQNSGGELRDEEVVAAMKKGVEYLLKQSKGNHFETLYTETGAPSGQKLERTGNGLTQWNKECQQFGGETSLILYTLLHVGQSIEDSRLTYRSKELAPVVDWLAKIQPDGTYTAALQASALALCPKRPETEAGMNRARTFLLTAMGPDGGYSYTTPLLAVQARRAAVEATIQDIRRRAADAGRNADANTKKALQDEFNKAQEELRKIDDEVKKARGEESDPMKRLRDAMKDVENVRKELADERRKGNQKDIGNKERELKEKELRVRELQQAARNSFAPIGDLSNAQYGALGAWALAESGIEIPTKYWEITDKFWRLTQLPSGAWPYEHAGTGKYGYRPSMGVAGIASLFVTAEFLDNSIALEPKEDKAIAAGLAWLDKEFDPRRNDTYYLYGVERIGLASGLKFFGTTNWYKEAARNLIRQQDADGSWSGGFWGAEKNIATSYALLFLARGRNPVVFNKLQYDGPWDARRRDNANITAWMSKTFERPINWQVVNLQVDPQEWLDAPVLLITGSRDPKFSAEDIAKLRAYVEAGGIIFSTADGGKKEFTDAIKDAMVAVADKKFEPRELPAEHPVFDLWERVEKPVRLLGLSNGVREMWIHSTEDLGASWQRRAFASKQHFTVPANLYFYATGKGSLRSKLQPLSVPATKENPARTVGLARLEYAGNWDPEPGAWARAAKLAAAEYRTKLNVTPVKIAELDFAKTPVAHMTGTTPFAVRDEDVAALKKFIDAGGTLLVDAAGGSPEFTKSALALVKAATGSDPQPLPTDHAVYAGTMADGKAVEPVNYRTYAKLKEIGGTKGRLLGVKKGDRTAVVLSAEDITSGLLGTNTWGIIGYDNPTAEALVRNMVLMGAGK